MSAKTFFERLYLVLELRKNVLCVSCPYAPTTLPIHSTTITQFLGNFFPRMAPQFLRYTIHQRRADQNDMRSARPYVAAYYLFLSVYWPKPAGCVEWHCASVGACFEVFIHSSPTVNACVSAEESRDMS